MKKIEDYLQAGVTPFHVVKETMEQLEELGYEEIDWGAHWKLNPGGNYMTMPFDSMVFAFHMGEGSLRIATAHTDAPTFKIKPSPSITKKSGVVVNVDKYGGMVYSNFLDRPLGLAGKIVCKGDTPFVPKVKLWDSKKGVAMIPSLAIHMNRKANEEGGLKVQTQLLPMIQTKEAEDGDALLQYIAKEISCKVEDILDYELFFYNTEKPVTVGLLDEYLMSPKLDNLTSCYSLIRGMEQAKNSSHLVVSAFFDNEEIGSRTKQGADSYLLRELILRITEKAGQSEHSLNEVTQSGFLLSLDVAHACHPNYEDKSDPTTMTKLGEGVVVKTSSTGRYSGDSESTGMLLGVCQAHGIKVQRQINHSDIPGGSTLGPIATAYLPMRGADVGIGILAMHSAMECGAKSDIDGLIQFVKAYVTQE